MAISAVKIRAMVTALRPVEALATTAGNLTRGAKRVMTAAGERTIYQMGMVAALVFAGQMFDFSISQGTSGHLIGGVFAAMILGPAAGALVIAAVLMVQMLFFSDGGLLAIGANIINMSFFGTIVGYYIYYYLKKTVPEWVAIPVAAWVAVLLAAFSCALELGLSGAIPYEKAIPAMLNVNMVIGVAEALITLALVNIFRSMFDMRKIIVLLLVLFAASQAQAAVPYIFCNTTSGALAGGLGFDFEGGRAVDFALSAGSGPSGSTYQLYFDYYIGCWGAGVTAKKVAVNSDLAFDLNLQYALEQAINEKLFLGASCNLINYDTTVGADPNWTVIPSFDAYIKLLL